MLDAARDAGVERVLAVSSAVYPRDSQAPTPEEDGVRGAPEPINAGYGWSKRMVGTVEWCQANGFRVIDHREGGYDGSIRAGVRAARGDVIIEFPPDGNSVADRIPALLAEIERGADPPGRDWRRRAGPVRRRAEDASLRRAGKS